MSVINPLDVVEVRVNWERVAGSPWAGCRLVSRVKAADGEVCELPSREALGLLAALRAAGARLVESVEGWGRVVRVTSDERRATSEEGRELRTTNDERRATNGEAGGTPAIQSDPVRPRPGSVAEAIEEMVALGKKNRPALAGRLDSAAELVRDGLVAVDDDSARIGPYVISTEACTCPDFRHRKGWCKHRLAARMARHLVANGFALPRAAEPEKCPQVRPKDLAGDELIEKRSTISRTIRLPARSISTISTRG